VDQYRPAAEEFGSRLEFETLISDISASLFAAPIEQIDRVVQNALDRVRTFFRMGRSGLLSVNPDQQVVKVRLASYADGVPHVSSEVDLGALFPWSRHRLLVEHKPVRVARLADLPPEAGIERQSWIEMPIRSALTFPIETGGIVSHLIILNAVDREFEWPDHFVTRLRVLGEMLVSALERQSIFARLRDAEERMNLAADSAGAGLWSLDYETRMFWITERTRAIFGLGEDDALSMERLEAAVHPEDWHLVLGAIERSHSQTDPVEVEYRIVGSDGQVRWIASRGRAHFTKTGAPDHLMGVSSDVTERKQAIEALEANRSRLECGAELAGLGFYAADFTNDSMYVDDRMCQLCGVPDDHKQGLAPLKFWMEHLHPEDREHVMDAREQMQDGRIDKISVEYRYIHPSAGQKWIDHLAGVSARNAAGRALHTYGVLRDISARREAEEALRRSYAEIERLKDKLQAEGEYLKAEIKSVQAHGEVTGQSLPICKVLRMVEQVASTDSTVLVRGETGTGKELIAQAIHGLSPRRNNVMVKVNCAALPSGLVESELFGREKGAYTGALSRQVGRFEVADGSTLFLDEIGELSLDVQAKLLRVLESGEFERLGSPRTIKVNVRLIAATNRDLADFIKQGKFREDLYYRLSVFPIQVPPLRDRPEDIPLLVWRFLEEFSSRMGKKITQVPRKTMEALRRHSWPGNVRELRNVIEHGAIITSGDTLRIPLLDEAAPVATHPKTLADAEREHILRALEKAHWHIKGPKGAAAELGLNPATLYSRMKKLGIRLGER
jgi:formate hydrogenlyase transcriptional activator